jgi:hypothetical protein
MRRKRAGLIALLLLLLVAVILLLLRGCDHRAECGNNLSRLGERLRAMTPDKRRATMKLGGAAMFLSWRKDGRVVRRGDESLLRCPDDPDLRALNDDARTAYDQVDLANPPDDLCSYAVRDFDRWPLPTEGSLRGEIIACCRQGRDGATPHHRGGVVALFGEGDVQFLTRDDLGLVADEPLVVGPESKVPMLQKMIQRWTK